MATTQQTSPVAITGETATHYVLRAITPRGQVFYGKWAKDSGPAPTRSSASDTPPPCN